MESSLSYPLIKLNEFEVSVLSSVRELMIANREKGDSSSLFDYIYTGEQFGRIDTGLEPKLMKVINGSTLLEHFRLKRVSIMHETTLQLEWIRLLIEHNTK